MTKYDLRLKLIHHPNPKRIIEDNFSQNYSWNDSESLYWNIINFLEIVRVNNLWNKLEKSFIL